MSGIKYYIILLVEISSIVISHKSSTRTGSFVTHRIKNMSKNCLFNKKGNFCPSFSIDVIPIITSSAKPAKKKSRMLYNSQHSATLRPVLKYVSRYLTHPVTTEIRVNSPDYLFQSKHATFYYNVTKKIYSTEPNDIKHLLNESFILPTQYVKEHNTNGEIKKMVFENPQLDKFFISLEKFENLLYQTSFNKLTSDSKENGISFVQTGLFLYLALLAISTEVDKSTKADIETSLGINATTTEKIDILKHIIAWLPISNNNLKLRWASRLVLNKNVRIKQQFTNGAAKAMNLYVDRLNGRDTPEILVNTLNSMVALDSGGALRNTFDEDDVADGVCSVLLTTLYIRAQWRSAPTVLSDSRTFYYSGEPKEERSVRMIRINDIIRYAALKEWNAEAIEINYATPGLTLLMMIPKDYSLKNLTTEMSSPQEISERMRTIRGGVTLPLYTLRMTLLLPAKLRTMGLSRLVNTKFTACNNNLRLSHAVQRLMFWSEAGRIAYKDDGLEWDETPELELLVNRPYIFFVRWHNITLMNGNFVL